MLSRDAAGVGAAAHVALLAQPLLLLLLPPPPDSHWQCCPFPERTIDVWRHRIGKLEPANVKRYASSRLRMRACWNEAFFMLAGYHKRPRLATLAAPWRVTPARSTSQRV